MEQPVNYSLCGCYKKESFDSRCCGLCYCIKRSKMNKVNEADLDLYNLVKCYVCPNTLFDYTYSGYFNTDDDCLCTACTCPVKFPLFFVCFLGSIINNCVNYSCSTNRNYLF